MKKTFKLQDLDCANCAAKMETAIARLPGVTSIKISFLSQKLTLEADEDKLLALLDEIEKAIARVEPDCRLVR